MSITVERPPRAGDESSNPFGAALRDWRRHRGWSQLDLSLEAGISSRHLSFLETGRSRPSRAMVFRLLDSLDVPLRERNRILLCAGFAPGYSESNLDDECMRQVKRVLEVMLRRHEPYPAYAMDGAWNLVDSNQTYRRLLERSLPDAPARQTRNILRLFFSPDLLRPFVVDWEISAAIVLRRVERQLAGPGACHGLREIFQEIRGYEGVETLLESSPPADPPEVFIPVAVRTGETTLRWLTTIITFGGALDVTLDDLVAECFFPADESTERFIDQHFAASG